MNHSTLLSSMATAAESNVANGREFYRGAHIFQIIYLFDSFNMIVNPTGTTDYAPSPSLITHHDTPTNYNNSLHRGKGTILL